MGPNNNLDRRKARRKPVHKYGLDLEELTPRGACRNPGGVGVRGCTHHVP